MDKRFFPVQVEYTKGQGSATCEGWFEGKVEGGPKPELLNRILEKMFEFRRDYFEIRIPSKRAKNLKEWLYDRGVDSVVEAPECLKVTPGHFQSAVDTIRFEVQDASRNPATAP